MRFSSTFVLRFGCRLISPDSSTGRGSYPQVVQVTWPLTYSTMQRRQSPCEWLGTFRCNVDTAHPRGWLVTAHPGISLVGTCCGRSIGLPCAGVIHGDIIGGIIVITRSESNTLGLRILPAFPMCWARDCSRRGSTKSPCHPQKCSRCTGKFILSDVVIPSISVRPKITPPWTACCSTILTSTGHCPRNPER